MSNTEIIKIDEQINIAKSLVGKYIKSIAGNGIGRVERYEIFSELDRESQFNSTWYQGSNLNESLKVHGVFVALVGIWSSGKSMLFPIPDYPVTTKTCEINGYLGVDKGDHYEWGCAKVDKDLLRSAKLLLETSKGTGNRSVTSIKIGKGDFNLKNINLLEL